MSKINFNTWAKTACYQCGDEFQVTRMSNKSFEKEEDIICEECQIWNIAFKEGYEKGLKDGSAKLQKLNHFLNEL